MRKTALAAVCTAVLAGGAASGAMAQDVKETICAQGTYSEPCPQVIWCPATNCGIGIPKPDGQSRNHLLDRKEDGRDLAAAGSGRLADETGNRNRPDHRLRMGRPGKVEQAGSDLTIKDILYVVMPPANAG